MTTAAASPVDRISYTDLYARWERGNWRATEIDFTVDREQWQERFSDFERKAAVWNYALFFWGEDAVADGLSPYIDAAPTEEQKYFLATQQVDEARHAVFFARFMNEVVGIDGGSVGASLAAIEPQLTWGFRKIFGRLEQMSDELRRDRSLPKLAQAITLYHLVIEATLAQPGQHFITSYLHERELLPGFREGMDNVAQDEQRHIGFGVKMLSDLVRQDPDCRPAVAELLREIMPWAAAVLVPPNFDRRYTECFGFAIEDIGEEASESLETKLRSAGLAAETLPGPPVFPFDLSPRERAERGLTLVWGGVLGEKLGPPKSDPQTMRALFEMIRGSLDLRAKPPGPATIQWDFRDAEPWHLRLDEESARVEPGRAERPTLTIKGRYEDFVDVAMGRANLARALVRGRLRARGDLRWLWRARAVFPR